MMAKIATIVKMIGASKSVQSANSYAAETKTYSSKFKVEASTGNV
jgi:hypothetical protein